ncbi:hypothetical protein B0I35DRAFT_427486 [Stachybotrys elegans]|uniref:Uncharacterized protein n=1 Tax=Stachybotrys elegans TaxID=80388 RepID=A0A8K0SPE5_9HYPO|nr:hypothetical protein B0I35DRAFT_427486 [Stachybotrys elegans]
MKCPIALIALALAGSVVNAGPIAARQLGSIECNLARFRIVSALGSARSSINNIEDETIKTAATAGLEEANSGISQIAKAILTGQAPPQESRDVVAAGLSAMDAALSSVNSTDVNIAKSRSSLLRATAAGQDVVTNC